jgi:2,4-dienoyl-CoA reductase-like NADH-dependent reductase (Old Yellow Enzyme family)
MAEYYAQLIVRERTYIAPPGKSYAWRPGMQARGKIEGLCKVTDAYEEGVPGFVQASVASAQCQRDSRDR